MEINLSNESIKLLTKGLREIKAKDKKRMVVERNHIEYYSDRGRFADKEKHDKALTKLAELTNEVSDIEYLIEVFKQ